MPMEPRLPLAGVHQKHMQAWRFSAALPGAAAAGQPDLNLGRTLWPSRRTVDVKGSLGKRRTEQLALW